MESLMYLLVAYTIVGFGVAAMAMFNASEPKQLQQKTILSPAEFNAQRKKEGEQGA